MSYSPPTYPSRANVIGRRPKVRTVYGLLSSDWLCNWNNKPLITKTLSSKLCLRCKPYLFAQEIYVRLTLNTCRFNFIWRQACEAIRYGLRFATDIFHNRTQFISVHPVFVWFNYNDHEWCSRLGWTMDVSFLKSTSTFNIY